MNQSITIIQRLDKPRYGDPCNGCGSCCILTRCPIGEALFPESDGRACPALISEGVKMACGIINDPTAYLSVPGAKAADVSAAIALMLGVGLGCDAVSNLADMIRREEIKDDFMTRLFSALAGAPPEVRRVVDYFRGE